MTNVDKEKLRGVGKVLSEALLMSKGMVKPGVKLITVAEAGEKFVRDKGYGLAFPMNISINEQAAHYTPCLDDDKVFTSNDLVKLDFGTEKDGYLGDCAVTVDLTGKYSGLVSAANEAMAKAISVVKAGVKVNEIGKVIAESIESKGFFPIKNLGGHGVNEHELHAEPFIPNYDNGDETELEEGQVIALEPFATNGKGFVADSDIHEIFSYVDESTTRSADSRLLLKEIAAKYKTEPFAARWLSNKINSRFRLYAAMGELMRAGAITPHSTLVEVSNGMVSQSEAQLIVEKDGCEVLAKV